MGVVHNEWLGPEQGGRYVQHLSGTPGRKLVHRGYQFSAPIGTKTGNSYTFAQARDLQGAGLEVYNSQPGDYVEFAVLDGSNNIVHQFAETVYVGPDGKIEPIIAAQASSIPVGYKARVEYTATGSGSTRTVNVWFRTAA